MTRLLATATPPTRPTRHTHPIDLIAATSAQTGRHKDVLTNLLPLRQVDDLERPSSCSWGHATAGIVLYKIPVCAPPSFLFFFSRMEK